SPPLPSTTLFRSEPDLVAVVEHVLAEDVEGLLVAVEGRPDVLGRPRLGALAAAPGDEGARPQTGGPAQGRPDVLGPPRLGALAAAPGDEGARPQLGGQVEVVGDLADREPAHVAVVFGEPAVAEHRVGEQV